MAKTKEYTVSLYEFHASKFKVTADNLEDAIESARADCGTEIEGSTEYIEAADDMGFEGIRNVALPNGVEIHWDVLDNNSDNLNKLEAKMKKKV